MRTFCAILLLMIGPALAQPDLKSEYLSSLDESKVVQITESRNDQARYLVFTLTDDGDATLARLRRNLSKLGWEFKRGEESKVKRFDCSLDKTKTELMLKNVTSRKASRVRGMGCDILYENAEFSIGKVVNLGSPYFDQFVLVIRDRSRIG